MGRLMIHLAEDWPLPGAVAAKAESFAGDLGPAGHSVPLRIAGGLHALVLSGRAPDLAQVYPPEDPNDRALADAIVAAFDTHSAFLCDWLDSAPQTNEIRRSAALIAGAHEAARRFDLPIWLSELGASGGINLNWDHYALAIAGHTFGPKDAVVTLRPDWDGPLPASTRPRVAARRGVDLNPLDLSDADGRLRAQAYLWPDQPERLEMTRAAARLPQPAIDRADAVDWLAKRLDAAPDGHLHLVQNTVAWQYFPTSAQDLGQALIDTAGANATRNRPLAWLQMENDSKSPGAAITLHIWPGREVWSLGRADFHGRWLRWHPVQTA